MSEKKILYLVSTLGGGGAENLLCSFAKELKASNPDISFTVCALKEGGVIENRLQESKINYIIIGGKGILHHALQVAKLVKKEKINIIHAHMLYSDIVARMAKIFTKYKLVATHHGLGKWKKKSLIVLDKLTKRMVDMFIMVSDESRAIRISREKYPPEKIKVIYNGVPDSFCENIAKQISVNEKIIIGTIARFTDNKQINVLIDVIYSLRKEYNNIYLDIIGEGENEKKLKQQVHDLKLEDYIVFHGWVDDIKPIIDHWKIFVLCSVNEDLPVSMLETMAQGIVPVASNVGGIPRLLLQGNLGVLCQSSNHETFVNAIKWLIQNPSNYKDMSIAAINHIKENYLISTNVNKTISIYNEL